MGIEGLIANAGRLRILTALAAESQLEFVHLRQATRMTDGNLATHARRLQAGGMLAIGKQFRDGKPVTTYTLTEHGRDALRGHVLQLMAAVGLGPSKPAAPPPAPVQTHADASDDNWID